MKVSKVNDEFLSVCEWSVERGVGHDLFHIENSVKG